MFTESKVIALNDGKSAGYPTTTNLEANAARYVRDGWPHDAAEVREAVARLCEVGSADYADLKRRHLASVPTVRDCDDDPRYGYEVQG